MARIVPTLKARSRFKQRLLFGMVLRPLRLFCDHCDKYVPSDMEWRCSHCNGENVRTRFYSFLHKCQHCKRPPKSYVCPHCADVNFLDRDEDATHPARSSGRPVPPELPEDPRLRKRQAHEERKEDLEHEITLARLDAELVTIKASAEFAKEKSAHEKLEKSFSAHDAHVMAAHQIAKRERANNAERYKDDPELRKMADESVKDWLEQHI